METGNEKTQVVETNNKKGKGENTVKKQRKARVKLNIDDSSFIRSWQAANDRNSVAKELNITLSQVNQRSMALRKHGVPLKQMHRGIRKNWQTLIDLAKSLA